MEFFKRKRFEVPSQSGNESTKENLPDNVVTVEAPEARYRIVYEFHQHRRKHEKRAFEGVDAVGIEAVDRFDEQTPFLTGVDPVRVPEGVPPGFTEGRQEYLPYLAEQNVPLYFFDIYNGKAYTQIMELTEHIRGAEVTATAIAGAYAALKGVQMVKKPRLNRRDFLKLGAAAAVVAKGGLAVQRTEWPDDNKQMSGMERTVRHAQEMLSPELNAIQFTLRNALWAYKMKSVIAFQSTARIQRKPDIAAIVGAAHIGLEDMLKQDPEALLEVISNVMTALKRATQILGIERPAIDITKTARYEIDHDRNSWKLADMHVSDRLAAIQHEYDT